MLSLLDIGAHLCSMAAMLRRAMFGLFLYPLTLAMAGDPVLDIDATGGLTPVIGKSWRFQASDSPNYAKVTTDDSHWPLLNIRTEWRLQGVNYEGVAWFRRKFRVPPALRNSELGLLVPTIAAAHEIYVNGRLLGGSGKIAPDGSLQEIRENVQVHRIAAAWLNPGGENLLAFRIRSISTIGGVYGDLDFLLGEYGRVLDQYQRTLVFYSLLSGALLLIGLYYSVLYLSRRKQKAPLYFSLYAIALGLFVLGMKGISFYLWDSYNFQLFCVHFAILTLPLWLLNLAIAIFAATPGRLLRLMRGASVVNMVLFVPVLVRPELLGIYMNSVFLFAFLLIAGALVSFLLLTVSAMRKGLRGAAVVASGFLVYFLCTVNDMLSYLGVIHSVRLTDLGFLVFTFALAIALALRIAQAYRETERAQGEMLRSQMALADSYARFVPREFLTSLGKTSILDVKLGDQVRKEMTVLFSDIRSFTRLSESMTPEQNFNFVNSYLQRMSPIIQNRGGFIDKFIGDGIMALFENQVAAAFDAGIDMQVYLKEYNRQRARYSYPPIEIGVGVHSGNLMLGTIGSETRMDGTVISDAVNLAARLESLTKAYGVKITTSRETLAAIHTSGIYHARFIDRVVVVGKTKPVDVFEIMNSDEPEILAKKLDTLQQFDAALASYYQQHFDEAKFIFEQILAVNPSDRVARIYLERCLYHREHSLPPDWAGVTSLLEK